jgi:cGMP-dependent protein kinase
MKLVRTYKDEQRVYFLTEYVNGADLFDVIRDIGLLNNDEARFYTACMLNIIMYLHEREIMYRDLKPENVMVGPDGYPKLIDFGTALICKDRTYTVVGTPHYMAPEVITGKGYE